MHCSICEKDFDSRKRANCTSCARAVLYKSRIEQAGTLLDREKWHAHLEAVTRPGNDGVLAALPEDADWDSITNRIQSYSFERIKAEMVLADERIKGITASADKLRREIEAYKTSAEERRGSITRRRQELSLEKERFGKHQPHAMESIHTSTKKASYRLEKVHKRTADARQYLCGEASSLSGLRRVKREDGRTEYHLAGLLVPDLRDLNGINNKVKGDVAETSTGIKSLAEPHEVISASLENVARLLGLCCYYLAIRLPAQITLPHNASPYAAILPKDSSYRTQTARYPSNKSSQPSSPAASRGLQRNDHSRPRLLQLDRPLPQYQKEEPKAALLFLEAVTLLAYDVAWLCRSQGVDNSITSFGDICAIGKNLHQLFLGGGTKDEQRPVLNRALSSATGKGESPMKTAPETTTPFGTHSHGSVHHSLAGHAGISLFNQDAWPVRESRLADQLKSYLRQELARAEWHVVDDTEWDEVLESDKPVLVGGTRKLLDPTMSVLSVRPSDGTDEADLPVRERGGRGWMKVRGREGEG